MRWTLFGLLLALGSLGLAAFLLVTGEPVMGAMCVLAGPKATFIPDRLKCPLRTHEQPDGTEYAEPHHDVAVNPRLSGRIAVEPAADRRKGDVEHAILVSHRVGSPVPEALLDVMTGSGRRRGQRRVALARRMISWCRPAQLG